jgi:hypothetical protein
VGLPKKLPKLKLKILETAESLWVVRLMLELMMAAGGDFVGKSPCRWEFLELISRLASKLKELPLGWNLLKNISRMFFWDDWLNLADWEPLKLMKLLKSREKSGWPEISSWRLLQQILTSSIKIYT